MIGAPRDISVDGDFAFGCEVRDGEVGYFARNVVIGASAQRADREPGSKGFREMEIVDHCREFGSDSPDESPPDSAISARSLDQSSFR